MTSPLTPAEILKRFGVALTGGIGTGKSTVARMIAAKGVPVIDADRLAREVTAKGQPALREIVAMFGKDVLLASGELDRKKLGGIVFADAAKLKALEGITHPAIRAALARELEKQGLVANPRPFIYEASLIYENGLEVGFKAVWVTSCPEAVQIRRVIERDGLPEGRVRQVLASQMPVKEKAARADLVIETGETLATVEAQVVKAVKTLS